MEEKKYVIKQGYVTREIAGEYIAVPVDSSCGTGIVILNPVSKFLWEELREEKTFDELLENNLRFKLSALESDADRELLLSGLA